jgi:hypothetical protein
LIPVNSRFRIYAYCTISSRAKPKLVQTAHTRAYLSQLSVGVTTKGSDSLISSKVVAITPDVVDSDICYLYHIIRPVQSLPMAIHWRVEV